MTKRERIYLQLKKARRKMLYVELGNLPFMSYDEIMTLFHSTGIMFYSGPPLELGITEPENIEYKWVTADLSLKNKTP